MILVLFSWIMLFSTSMILGAFLLKHLFRMNRFEYDMAFFSGLMGLTVYAQFFSLFSKVGKNAWIVLGVVILIMLGYFIHTGCIKIWRNEFRRASQIHPVVIVLGILFIVVLAALTTEYAQHPDTELYHAQAIRWIEEYGIVKGIGNLHFRLAYNSSFMALQALFSFAWLCGQSLHTVNGGLVCFLFLWCLLDNHLIKNEKLQGSDLMKVVIVFYLFHERNIISSPNTDLMALSLAGYIITKWLTYQEQGIKDMKPYAALCILAVWGMTLKLSVAPLLILVIVPAIQFIKEKQYKEIALYIGMGFICALPWIIRSVLISGYLVYPYAELDLFNFVWEMPRENVIYDRKEICVWGRGLRDVSKYDWGITEWFPVWFSELTKLDQLILGVGVVSVIASCFAIIYMIYKRSFCITRLIPLITSNCLLFLWFFSAPLMRYGQIFLLINFVVALGFYPIKWQRPASFGMAFLLILITCNLYARVSTEPIGMVSPIPYGPRELKEVKLGEFDFWLAEDNSYVSYYQFPSINYETTLDCVAPIGDSIKDGFYNITVKNK